MLGTLLILVWVSVWFTPTPITFGHFLNNLIYYNHWQEMTQQSTPHPPQFHVRFTQQMLIVPIYKDTSKVSPGIPGIHLHFPGISYHFLGLPPHLPGFYHILRGLFTGYYCAQHGSAVQQSCALTPYIKFVQVF